MLRLISHLRSPLDRAGHDVRPAVAHVATRSLQQRVLALMSILFYLLPGLTGHQPWKQDETYIAEIVRTMLAGGDWVVPRMAGEVFVEKPPLYYWIAALCVRLSGHWLALHDGARLANLLLLGSTCIVMERTARLCWSAATAALAPLLLLACLGTALHAHFLLTDLAMLPGVALCLYGVCASPGHPRRGGLLLGAGIALGFMAKGLFLPCAVALWLLLLPLLFARWRGAAWRSALLWAGLVALPLLLAWPCALYLRSPAYFVEWFWLNNVGRFTGFSVPALGAAHPRFFWLATLPWFAAPALPFALAACCLRRRRRAADDGVSEPALLLCAVMLALLVLSASARNNYALPMLVPMALCALPAVTALPAAVDRRLALAVGAAFALAAAYLWVLYLKISLPHSGLPWLVADGVLPHAVRLPFDTARAALAALLTVAALAAALGPPAPAGRCLYSWTIGLALSWCLIASLLLPWIDAAKSYRAAFTELHAVLPRQWRCIGGVALGESERALLSYYFGIVSVSGAAAARCDLLLVESTPRFPLRPPDPQWWVLRWQGGRPGDVDERFLLFVRRTGRARQVAAGAVDMTSR